MNKPLLSARQPRRISLRETALALLALGCAAGWLHERMNNRTSAEVQPFVDSLRELRREMQHDPDAIVNKTIKSGDDFVSCRMRRAGADAPAAAKAKIEPATVNDGRANFDDRLQTDHNNAVDSQGIPAANGGPLEAAPKEPASVPGDSTSEDKSP
jgi:hypothetical protein